MSHQEAHLLFIWKYGNLQKYYMQTIGKSRMQLSAVYWLKESIGGK